MLSLLAHGLIDVALAVAAYGAGARAGRTRRTTVAAPVLYTLCVCGHKVNMHAPRATSASYGECMVAVGTRGSGCACRRYIPDTDSPMLVG